MPIKQLLLDETLNFIDTYVKEAVININGTDTVYPIFKTKREPNRLKKFVYMQSETGEVSNAKLVDAQGRELQAKALDVQKNEDGLMIVFVIDLAIKGGE